MQNQQLVDYIKQQIQGGVSVEAVRKALIDAGWPAPDVEDSIRAATPSSASAGQAASSAVSPAAKTIDPVAAMDGGISGQGGVSPVATAGGMSSIASKTTFFADGPHAATEPKHSWTRVAVGTMAVVIVILLAALGYVYYSLNGKVTATSGESTTSASETQSLQDQLAKISQDKNELTGQVATLTSDNQVLFQEISFLAAGEGAVTTSTIKGTIGGAAGAYTLKSAHGIVVTVKNSKDAKVDATLKPLIGQTAELTGTHKPGALDLTVTLVNGAIPAIPPAPAATSTPPVSTSTTP